MLQWIEGKVVPGHGIASGARGCQEMGGTINAQRPFFKRLGFDMDAYNLHNGTINVDISPFEYEILKPFFKVENMFWHEDFPPETFSMCECLIRFKGVEHKGFVYYPHPETKPIEFLGNMMFEILCPHISDITYGHDIEIGIYTEQINLIEQTDKQKAVRA